MFSRHKIAQLFGFILLLITITAQPLYSAWWERDAMPLPAGTEELFQETRNMAGTEFLMKYYANTEDAKAISDFYRSKLPVLGWKERELLKELRQIPNLKMPASAENMLAVNTTFEKEGEMLMINFLPRGAIQDGKTRFVIARGKIDAEKETGKDDFIPRLSGKPKLDIAPVYPDAALISLSENAGFMRATYFVKGDIERVSEFYKSKMLDYDWSLTEEKPLENLPSTVKPAEATARELDFSNKEGDLCMVALTNSGPEKSAEDKLENATIVVVQYEKAGK